MNLKERYLQVSKKEFELNFVKNIFQTLPRKRFFITNLFGERISQICCQGFQSF